MTDRLLELRRVLACSAATLVLFSAGTAMAQDASPEPGTDNEVYGSTDIVVTALKRETRLQETPLAISAVTGDALQNQGSSSVADMVRQVPGLNITEGNTGQRRITIRGVQSAGESTVGLYLGDTPITGPNSATSDPSSITPDLNMFDVQRIEVLRGPQGTLYGSGSMSGTLKFVFNEPSTTEYSGAFDGSIADVKDGGTSFSTRGMVNAPLVDGLIGLRVVGYYEKRAGYIDNVVLKQTDINEARSYGARIMLRVTPTDNLTISGMATLQEQNADDSSYWYPQYGDYKVDNAHKIPFPNSFRLYNAKAEYDFGFATATATSSHYTWDATKYIDGTRSALNASNRGTYCSRYFGITGTCTTAQRTAYSNYILAQLPLSGYQPMDVSSWVHEVRLSSDGKGWLDWTVGAFRESRSDSAVSSTVEADPVTGVIKFPIVYNFSRTIAVDLKQTAFFGEVTLRPIRGLSITGGLRRYSYDKNSIAQVLTTSYINGSTAGPPTTKNDDASGWVSKLNISYEPMRDILIYATRSEGFRPGGINTTPGLPPELVPYTSDSLVNYEVGLKTSWFDRKLTLNLSAYQINWDDMQISASIPSFSFITNVGASRIRGVELEMNAQPIDGLSLSGNMAYQNGKLRADQRSGTIEAPGLKGDKLPYEPYFTAALGAEYSWSLVDDISGFARVDYSYTGRSYSEFRPTSIYYEKMGNFSNVNLRLGVENKDWGIFVFANNLFDTVGRIKVSSGVLSEQQTLSTPPRTIGLNVRRNF